MGVGRIGAAWPPRASRVSLPRALSKLSVCSRAQAFALIAAGRVRIDDRVAPDPAIRIDLRHQRVTVDGVLYSDERPRVVVALNKPRGVVTTRSDPQGRKTVYDLLGDSYGDFLFPIGRLDRETRGLLLFTNDHRLGDAITDPDRGTRKTYRVLVTPVPDAAGLAALRRGISIGRDETTRPANVVVRSDYPAGETELEIQLKEGRNRQVRRMCAAIGLAVRDLRRVAIGSLSLDGSLRSLPEGSHRRLNPAERGLLTGA